MEDKGTVRDEANKEEKDLETNNVRDNAVYQQLLKNLPKDASTLQNLVIQNMITIQQQQNEYQELQRKHQELESENKDLHAKNRELETENEKLDHQIGDNEEEIEYNVGRKDELKEEIDDLKR